MSYARQLLDTYPRDFNLDALPATIDALSDCAQACTACADDCLSEPQVAELVKCIRLCLDCADSCTATLRVLSRQTEYDANLTRPQLQGCVAACNSCGGECGRHAGMHAHCRVCAEASVEATASAVPTSLERGGWLLMLADLPSRPPRQVSARDRGCPLGHVPTMSHHG
jgi:hypothetical protein